MRGVSNQIMFDADTDPKPENTHSTPTHVHNYCSERKKLPKLQFHLLKNTDVLTSQSWPARLV